MSTKGLRSWPRPHSPARPCARRSTSGKTSRSTTSRRMRPTSFPPRAWQSEGVTIMRITQGCFSYLPDLTDEQITAQVQFCLDKGWAVNIEFTDDPHPRNTYWEMWGLPMFD